ncbi:MAG: hypothetical protein GX299_07185 [Epulopiscium sp.]|nr:hypothetical protein [Candidatus Epulonipiscium sp.]
MKIKKKSQMTVTKRGRQTGAGKAMPKAHQTTAYFSILESITVPSICQKSKIKKTIVQRIDSINRLRSFWHKIITPKLVCIGVIHIIKKLGEEHYSKMRNASSSGTRPNNCVM